MYTVRCDRIREIAPMATLKKVPHTPDYFAGYFNYRGRIVPVIDLRRLIRDEPCEMRLSTRIILVDYEGKDGKVHVIGLMAERVTETVMKPDDAISPPGIRSEKSPYLGGIVMEGDQMIQHIELERLPESIPLLSLTESEKRDDAEAD
jgi:chemotaxis-related protein WspB